MRPFRVNIDHTIYILLCGFALFIPLSDILDVFFNVRTVLKPFRLFLILSIVLYGVKVLSHGFRPKSYIDDIPFYLVFVYGFLISLVQMMKPDFSMKLFNNDTFQISLYLLGYFIIKNVNLSQKQKTNILWSLIIGILINCFYLFNSFYFLGNYAREGGFMDNPNQVALSIVLAVAFFNYRISVSEKRLLRLVYIGMVFFLLFVFPVTGSRTGLAILLLVSLLIFTFASYKAKLTTFLAAGALVFFFLTQNLERFNVGASFVLTNRVIKKQNEEEKDVRFLLWDGALKAASDNYFLGIGIGQFKAKFSRIFQTTYHPTILEVVNRRAYLSAHSDYIGLITIYGIVGLLLYLFYLFRNTLNILRNMRFADSFSEQRFYQFCLMVLACLAAFGLTAENFISPIYWLLLALCTTNFIPLLKSKMQD